MAKYCGKCGTKLEPGLKYCPECGNKIAYTDDEIRESSKSPDANQTNGKVKKATHKKAIPTICVMLSMAILISGLGFVFRDKIFERLAKNNEGISDSTIGLFSPDNDFVLIGDSFTDRKITDSDSALLAIKDVADDLGISNVQNSLSEPQINVLGDNRYYRFHQVYQSFPVYGRDVIVVSDNEGNALSLSGNYLPIQNIQVEEDISESDACVIAGSSLNSPNSIQSRGLCVYTIGDENELAWHLICDYGGYLDTVFVSASTGELLDVIP